MSDDGYIRITLRIPEELHAKLTAAAASTSKSMNAEIIGRIARSFDAHASFARGLPPSLSAVIADVTGWSFSAERAKMYAKALEEKFGANPPDDIDIEIEAHKRVALLLDHKIQTTLESVGRSQDVIEEAERLGLTRAKWEAP